MVLHEKGICFEIHEVDLSNKSEEFLSVSPYGKVPYCGYAEPPCTNPT